MLSFGQTRKHPDDYQHAQGCPNTKPQRIQMSRRRGFNLQKVSMALNGLPAVNCARPSKWGNPFVVQFDPHPDYSPQTAEEAVKMYRGYMDKGLMRIAIRSELRGKNLACWCPLSQVCHCDVLLAISNGSE